MYCPDTLKRLNEEAELKHIKELKNNITGEPITCDFCIEDAVEGIPIYNPADALRDPPVTGIYSTMYRCQDCQDHESGRDDMFVCPDCRKHFIINHSWDRLAVTIDDVFYCQECAVKHIKPVELWDLVNALHNGDTSMFTRINKIPGKTRLWSGEFSSYSDFPGHTEMSEVADEINEAAAATGDMEIEVYPVIDHGYQFSVSLAVYY